MGINLLPEKDNTSNAFPSSHQTLITTRDGSRDLIVDSSSGPRGNAGQLHVHEHADGSGVTESWYVNGRAVAKDAPR